MKLNELRPAEGSTRESFRVGRGPGSGNGKTAGKGHKGQNARSGGGVRPGFEGGQLPLYRKLPKRGFNNIFATPYVTINVAVLNRFEEGAVVDAEALMNAGVRAPESEAVYVFTDSKLEMCIPRNLNPMNLSDLRSYLRKDKFLKDRGYDLDTMVAALEPFVNK